MDIPVDSPACTTARADHPQRRQATAALALLALGVVYGDIGTSPLYAAKETFNPQHGIPLTPENIIGGVSAIFWSLMIVVSLKYVTLVLRASNRGEGGIMALLALATASRARASEIARGAPRHRRVRRLAVLWRRGADARDLGALGGRRTGGRYRRRSSLTSFQSRREFSSHCSRSSATARVWSACCSDRYACSGSLSLGAVGVWNIAKAPAILKAIDPAYALHFVTAHGFASFVVLGSVLLAFTGAEALYADMGHFGKRAIRIAWFGVAAPGLVLNYFGQGALLIVQPAGHRESVLSRLSGVGAVSDGRARHGGDRHRVAGNDLGRLLDDAAGGAARLPAAHDDPAYVRRTMGQIYVPAVNWILLLVVIAAVIGFGSSSRLASAYGVAVMGTMLVTTLLTFFVLRYDWRYPLWLCVLATAFFLLIDAVFFTAALHKVLDGGWFPLALAAIMFCVMVTWRRGREALLERLRGSSPPLEGFLKSLFLHPPQRVPGTAVFLTSSPDATPNALLHSLKHYKVLHEQNVFLTVEFHDVPWVNAGQRVACDRLADDCWRVVARYGFMEQPDVALALEICGPQELQVDPMQVTYFLSREKIVPGTSERGMARWRDRLFAAMARNAGSISDFFNIPTNRVVELGTRIEL